MFSIMFPRREAQNCAERMFYEGHSVHHGECVKVEMESEGHRESGQHASNDGRNMK